MRRTVRLSPGTAQLVRDALGSKLMLGFVIVSGIYYGLLFASSILDGSVLSLSLVSILAQGFVTAESIDHVALLNIVKKGLVLMLTMNVDKNTRKVLKC